MVRSVLEASKKSKFIVIVVYVYLWHPHWAKIQSVRFCTDNNDAMRTNNHLHVKCSIAHRAERSAIQKLALYTRSPPSPIPFCTEGVHILCQRNTSNTDRCNLLDKTFSSEHISELKIYSHQKAELLKRALFYFVLRVSRCYFINFFCLFIFFGKKNATYLSTYLE